MKVPAIRNPGTTGQPLSLLSVEAAKQRAPHLEPWR